MKPVVFVGPTLSPKAVSQHLDARLLPPVRQGDVYRVVKENPPAIGIIDGFFDGVPSVWHKEILWAMEQGIPVFGSASMGALRAAELADFGMIGVGAIFEDYRSDVLQDDDEVAVLHSPAELGFQPLSEPMVSIRATVAKAQSDGVLPPDTATQVLSRAKALHYRERIWSDILGSLQDQPGVDDFAHWLKDGRVDAKATDAVAMLQKMADHLAGTPLPPIDTVRTEPTVMWKALRSRVDGETASDADAVIDELRLRPDLYTSFRDRAVLALLAREETTRRGQTPDRADLIRQMEAHRGAAGLTRRADLMGWIEDNDLTPERYEAMLTESAQTEAAIAARANRLQTQLLTQLRLSDDYPELRDRARNKARYTGSAGQSDVDRLSLLVWYFESHLDQEVPDDLDSYAVALGLTGRDAFYELIKAEYLYRQRSCD